MTDRRDLNQLVTDWVGVHRWVPDDLYKPIGLLGAMLAWHGDLTDRSAAADMAREAQELAAARARINAKPPTAPAPRRLAPPAAPLSVAPDIKLPAPRPRKQRAGPRSDTPTPSLWKRRAGTPSSAPPAA